MVTPMGAYRNAIEAVVSWAANTHPAAGVLSCVGATLDRLMSPVVMFMISEGVCVLLHAPLSMQILVS